MDLKPQNNNIILKEVTKFFIANKSQSVIEVFRNFSVELPSSKNDKIISFIGKSGTGKTTLLRLISGLEIPNSGAVFINSNKVIKPTGLTTLIPQKYTCYPWLTVYENIAFGLDLKGKRNFDNTVKNIANDLGLGNRLDAFPKELSGGMQQRVAIGRALAIDVPIILMDEPFGSLDVETREEMQQIILKIVAKSDKLVILVTHDLNEAILLSDTIFILPQKPITNILSNIKIEFKEKRTPELLYTQSFRDIYKEIKSLL